MIHLSKASSLSKVPTELQMDIIFYLPFHDAFHLKQTCRYFNFFFTEDLLEVTKQRQIAIFEEMDKALPISYNTYAGNVTLPDLPCYTCLRIKPAAEFYNTATNQYANVFGSQRFGNTTERFCIACGFKTGRFEKGRELIYRNYTRKAVHCLQCNLIVTATAPGTTFLSSSHDQTECDNCVQERTTLSANGLFIRFLQSVFSVIIFGLTCTGKMVPRSSVVGNESYPFMFTIIAVRVLSESLRMLLTTLKCLLTALGTVASLTVRCRGTSHYNRLKVARAQNQRFVLLTEMSALLAWIACMGVLIREGRRHTERFDRYARAVVGLELIEM